MTIPEAFFLIVGVLTSYLIYKVISGPVAVPGAALARKILRRRIFSLGVPKYCGYHMLSALRPGQIALLDSSRCETCAKEDKVKTKKKPWSFN